MRTIVKTQIVQWKSNAEFVVENELKGKDWDVVVTIINNGDFQKPSTKICKNLDEANQLLFKGDEIVKYEFRLWDDDDLKTYIVEIKVLEVGDHFVRAKSKDDAVHKIKNGEGFAVRTTCCDFSILSVKENGGE